MIEKDPQGTPNQEGPRVVRYSNPIRDAIFEATYGDWETALAIARGDIPGRPDLPPDGPSYEATPPTDATGEGE